MVHKTKEPHTTMTRGSVVGVYSCATTPAEPDKDMVAVFSMRVAYASYAHRLPIVQVNGWSVFREPSACSPHCLPPHFHQ